MKYKKRIVLAFFVVVGTMFYVIVSLISHNRKATQKVVYKAAVERTYSTLHEYLEDKTDENYTLFTEAFSKLPELANTMDASLVPAKRFYEISTMYSLLENKQEKSMDQEELLQEIVDTLYEDYSDENAYVKMSAFKNLQILMIGMNCKIILAD